MVTWDEATDAGGWPAGWIDGVRAVAGGPITLGEEAVVHVRYEALIWKDPPVRPAAPGTIGPLSGLALLRGPGRLALAGDVASGIVPLVLATGERLLLRPSAVLLATAALRRLEHAEPAPPREAGLAAFEAMGEALVLLQAEGGSFGATLGEDDSVDVAPGALLYTGPDVALAVVEQRLGEQASLSLVRCEGPGRVGVRTVPGGV